MNNEERYREDLLKYYLNQDKAEKAPEEFTSKVMYRVQVEAVPEKTALRQRRIFNVPVVSGAVTIILVLTALLIPETKSDILVTGATEFLKNAGIALPQFDISSLFRFNLPAIILYIFVAVLILSFFDRALYRVFHRQK